MKLDMNFEREIVENILKDKENSLSKILNEETNKIEEKISKKLHSIEENLSDKLKYLDDKINNKPIKINLGTVEKPDNKILHSKFDTIIKILQSAKRIEKHIMLVGPAGGGKTSLCSDVAKALKLDFYPMSVGLQTTKSDLVGFINAKGDYVTTPVREAFEKGGLLLLDEFDATNPSTVTILNAMLANDICSFPDKKIEKNKDFICIVACNTYGKGADINYIGRNRLDASTLDRFIVLDVDYDENLEKTLTKNDKWLKCIKKMRKNINQYGIKMVISPRASMQGADLLESGFSFDEVVEMTVLKGANEDIRTKVLTGVVYSDNSDRPTTVEKQTIDIAINIDTKSITASFETSCQLITNLDWEGINFYFSKEGEYLSLLDNSKFFINAGTNYIALSNGASFEKLIQSLNNAVQLPYLNKEIALNIIFFNGEGNTVAKYRFNN